MRRRPAAAVRFILALAVLAAPGLAAGDPVPDSAQTIVHTLDYIAVDYAGAVEEGKVKNEGEFKEMIEFAGRVKEQLSGLPLNPRRDTLAGQASELARLVADKAGAEQVAAAASRLRWGIIEAYGIQIAPKRPPDLARARLLYQEHCSACHGAAGHGDGPAAKGMEPPPADFHDAARMRQRSVYGLYSTISLGVAGTPMAAFGQLPEDDRWALAFHAANFAATDAERAQGEALWKTAAGKAAFPDIANVAKLSANEVKTQLGDAAAFVQTYLRARPEVLAAGKPAPIALAREKVAASTAAYRAGDRARASELAVQAYLDGFELVEPALRNVDASLVVETERAMMALRNLIGAAAPVPQVEEKAARVESLLAQTQETLASGTLSPGAIFVSALVILLREGLEALLVVAAIGAFLAKAGRRDAIPYVHMGWVGAVVLGLLTWAAAAELVEISGANREVIEGVTALVASAMLLYVGYWLHGKSSARAWQGFIRDRVGTALADGTLWAMAAVSFLAVYREMFETVLFYQVLWVQAGAPGRGAFFGGATAAVVALAAAGWAIFRFSVRLPLGPFFAAMSLLMCALAVVLAGKGVASLQEAGVIGADLVDAPTLPWLGVFPTWQTLGAQVLVLAVVLGSYLLARRRARMPGPAA
ncbi:MAG TPA: cytochrome c/FTR1 family iron permease [Burkholderiales bacterium]|nr:cytochrome c/FTR1 family iron permease [Burkholderiales bacterium]